MTIIIIEFVKDEGLPVVVWPPAHAVTIQKEDRNSSWVTVLCIVKKTNFTSVFAKVIPSTSFGMCGYPQIWTEKPSHFANWISVYELLSWKMKSYLLMMINCHLPILLLKLKWYNHLCKGCGMLFQRYRFCFNFTLIYCERWWWCLSLHLVVYTVFPNVFISLISSLTLCLYLFYCSSEC